MKSFSQAGIDYFSQYMIPNNKTPRTFTLKEKKIQRFSLL